MYAVAVNSNGVESDKPADADIDTHRGIFMLEEPSQLPAPSHFGKDQTGFTLSWARVQIAETVRVWCSADNGAEVWMNENSWSAGRSTMRINFN